MAKDALTKFNTLGKDFDPDSVAVMQEQFDEAKARLAAITAEGKLDETKLSERNYSHVASATGPLNRQLTASERLLEAERKKVNEAKAEADALKATIHDTQLRNSIRDGISAGDQQDHPSLQSRTPFSSA